MAALPQAPEQTPARAAQILFEALRAEDPAVAPARFLRLCALCALERRGWLPPQAAEPWAALCAGRAAPELAHRQLWQAMSQALPELFPSGSGDLPNPRWFGPGGPAAGLRRVFFLAAPQELPGLCGRLWESGAALPRHESFARLRRSQPHTGAGAAYATQLFTPAWLARFLVENTLGRLLGPGPDTRFWLATPQETVRPRPLLPQPPTLLDPCAGGGELLCRAFDLLLPRLRQQGLPPRQAVRLLLEHTLCGLDIDAGALGACYLELMLRGRGACGPDFWGLGLRPRLELIPRPEGALLAPGLPGFDGLPPGPAALLAARYDAVAANPPYMGLRGMQPALRDFLRQHYPDGKNDLYAAFALRCAGLTAPGGCMALLAPQGWLTLGSFEGMRRFFAGRSLPAVLRLGAHAFPSLGGEVVQAAAFVCRPDAPAGPTLLCALEDAPRPEDKEALFRAGAGRVLLPRLFPAAALPPGCRPLGQAVRVCQGLATGDNARFVRLWYEVEPDAIARGMTTRQQAAASGLRWFPYNKGGGFRRWWGNDLYLVDFARDGEEIRAQLAPSGRPRARVQNAGWYFRPGVSWSFVGSRSFSARLAPAGSVFDVGGSTAFPLDGDCLALAALLNSRACGALLARRNPTVNFQVGDVAALPLPALTPAQLKQVHRLAARCVRLSREEWEETEPAPAFQLHPWAACGAGSLLLASARCAARRRARAAELARCQGALDDLFDPLLGWQEPPAAPAHALPEQGPAPWAEDFLSWCVGAAAGRFPLPDGSQRPAAGCIPLWPGAENGLARQVTGLFAGLWPQTPPLQTLEQLAGLLGWRGDPMAALERWLAGPFFRRHAKTYLGRPVYWLCRALPGREVLLYYHGLGPGTLRRLQALWGDRISPALARALAAAGPLLETPDRDRGIGPNLEALAALGLAERPR